MNRTISVAPMMDWTDKHYRYFIRLLSQHTLLYTEMVTTGALIHGKQYHLLDFNASEHPIALQLGGSDPTDLAICCRMAEAYGYDEVNLNVGCPSDRVQKGRFGACLMAEPRLVADCVSAMTNAVKLPITVKTRIGIDDLDSYEHLYQFIQTVASAGCSVFIIHARKAWLNGLNPKQNREIPPLRYDVAEQLKNDFSKLVIVLNGGINSLDAAEQHLQVFDGVMIGREAYYNPYFFAEVDQRFYQVNTPVKTHFEVMDQFLHYIALQLQSGVALKHMVRHILGFFHHTPGAKQYRRHISENAYKPDAGLDVVTTALAFVNAQ